jgi:ABC-type nitrate/sulfonate/bicarbonate transport system permease component
MSGRLATLPASAWSTGSVVIGVLAWELGARAIDARAFPPFSGVVERLFELLGESTTYSHLASSLLNLALGFGISLVLGLGVGVAMGVSRTVDTALGVYVKAMLTAPSLVFAPIFFSVLGLSRWTIVGVVVLYSTFIIMLNTAAAIREAPAPLVEMVRSFCGGRTYIIRRVLLPSSVPLIMAGVRLGAGRAVKGMINGEMFIAFTGLGAMIMAAGGSFNAARVLALLLIITVVALLLGWAVTALDRRTTRWVSSTHR